MRTNKFIPLLIAIILHALPLLYLAFSKTNISKSVSFPTHATGNRTFDLENFSLSKKRETVQRSESPSKRVQFNNENIVNQNGKNIASSALSEASSTVDLSQTIHFIKYNAPIYPAIARQKGIEGIVKIKMRYDPDGNITTVMLTKSSGSKMLDEAVIKAAQSWKIEKVEQGEIEKTFEFKLNK